MRFSTALREPARRFLESLGHADIVIGIPAYNNDRTIANVIRIAALGLGMYFSDYDALILVADGGSVDDTRELAEAVELGTYRVEKLVTIYRGVPGKGSAIRAIFEAANFLKAQAVVTVDADLRSITPEWIKNLVDPIIDLGYDFVAPLYRRYKYDATITNTIAYTLTRALYGLRVRQPIGGDFAFSRAMVREYLEHDVWETDIARFGVDIWLTTLAIVNRFRIVQARLGVKVHDTKDPATHLGPMYRQVVSTIFSLMEQYVDFWREIKGSKEVPVTGEEPPGEPQAFSINVDALIEYFKLGMKTFGPSWKQVINSRTFRLLQKLAKTPADQFDLPVEEWAKIVYDFGITYHTLPRQRIKLIDIMVPLYYARVASLVNEIKDVPDDEVESFFERDAEAFEKTKPYLIRRWDEAERHAAAGGYAGMIL